MASQNSLLRFFPKRRKNNNEEQIDSNEDRQECIERAPRHDEAESSLEIPVAKFSQWDMGCFIMVKPTNEQKHNLMIRCWEPAKNHAFLAVMECKAKRRFRREYLGLYSPWLSWSRKL